MQDYSNDWYISDEELYGPQISHFSLKNFLAEVGFEPGSPSWEAYALSITALAHALFQHWKFLSVY